MFQIVGQVMKSLRDFMQRGADFAIVALATTAEFAATKTNSYTINPNVAKAEGAAEPGVKGEVPPTAGFTPIP